MGADTVEVILQVGGHSEAHSKDDPKLSHQGN